MTDDTQRPSLVWFRDDLRTTDHAALSRAAERGPVVGLYVLEELPRRGDDEEADSPAPGPRPLGAASKWWLHHSLHALTDGLSALGIELIVTAGDPRDVVPRIAADLDVSAVAWHRRYAPGARGLDAAVEARLPDTVHVAAHQGYLLTEPSDVATKQGHPYKVFTPFSRAAAGALDPESMSESAGTGQRPHGRGVSDGALRAAHDAIDALALTPDHPTRPDPDWTAGLAAHWTPGERGAHERLADFLARLETGLSHQDRKIARDGLVDRYADGRDFMAVDATSRLSPHLRFGEISPRRAWDAIAAAVEADEISAADGDAFHKELLWRDFAWHRRHHLPTLDTANTRPAFDAFPWAWLPGELDDARAAGRDPRDAATDAGDSTGTAGADGAGAPHLDALSAWRRGETGIDVVDAGMRELWATGYMHNRVRMIVGSLLTKNLGIHWRHGEEWFWDTLVDADEASNPFNWQWVAGCGDDAAPYFRIFNPQTQAAKFDPTGAYVHRWVPEAGAADGREPIVDLRQSRLDALAAYEFVKATG
ncbi:deoxyribodipyrimidine photo-lyase [uncultured Corynebacterium sp.]|uniref:cryptochrome/photolyase family protein n=1 Tax=uncultured Corynebacterium sp. TaxID=159447 RepID=UPI0025CF513D|nr:deoxyribodipyrimidine photo-lyase [uncultured Corynebacterium sp.]